MAKFRFEKLSVSMMVVPSLIQEEAANGVIRMPGPLNKWVPILRERIDHRFRNPGPGVADLDKRESPVAIQLI